LSLNASRQSEHGHRCHRTDELLHSSSPPNPGVPLASRPRRLGRKAGAAQAVRQGEDWGNGRGAGRSAARSCGARPAGNLRARPPSSKAFVDEPLDRTPRRRLLSQDQAQRAAGAREEGAQAPGSPGAAAARPAARGRAASDADAGEAPSSGAQAARVVGQKLGAIEPKWASAPRPSAPRAAPSLERLLEQLRSADAAVRRARRWRWASRAPARPSRAARALEDSEKAVRSAAAISLASAGRPGAARRDGQGPVRLQPALGGGVGGRAGAVQAPEVVEPLLAAFKTHNTSVGAAVAGALGMIRDARALPPLLEALKADFVPADACDALGALGTPRAAPGLTGPSSTATRRSAPAPPGRSARCAPGSRRRTAERRATRRCWRCASCWPIPAASCACPRR
jgi:hypothetical protein